MPHFQLSKAARKFGSFAGIGIFNTVAYFLVSNFLVLGLSAKPMMAGYLAYAALLPVSFLGHRKLTFRSSGAVFGEWLRFCVSQAANLVCIGLATFVVESMAAPAWVGFAAISVLVPAISFVLLQVWVFKKA